MPKSVGNLLNNAINKTFVKVLYDHFVLVEKFEYATDTVGDIQYSVSFKEFNENILTSSSNTAKSVITSGLVNAITNTALKQTGLL